MSTEKLDLNENFIDRGKSYKAGMLLLIKYLTDSDWKTGNKFSARLDLLFKKIETLYENYKNDLEERKISFEAGNAQLKSLIASYISLLVYHTRLEDPSLSLFDAERYAVMEKGRSGLDTQFDIETVKDGALKKYRVVQSEIPYTDAEILTQEYEPTKTWLQSLPQWQQGFIKQNVESLFKQSIPSSLRSIPGLANLSKHHCQIDDIEVLSYFRHATQTPIDLITNKIKVEEQFRLTCLNVASQIRLSIDDEITSTGGLNRQELVILTQSLLSPGLAASVKSEYFTDASDNDTLLYEMKERVVELFQRALSKPNAKIDAIDKKITRLFFTEEQQGATLYYLDFLAKFDLMAKSDGFFKYKEYKPIKITLLSTNHPFNVLRHFGVHSDQTKRNDINTAQLLSAVRRYLTPLLSERVPIRLPDHMPEFLEYLEKVNQSNDKKAKLSKLKKILDHYEENENLSVNDNKEKLIETLRSLLDPKMKELFDANTLRLFDALQALLSTPISQGVLTPDSRHYQMQISSAEAVILHCIGGKLWVACKSGKDRTGGASIAYDAAAAFCKIRGRHPRHDDKKEDRAYYLTLLKDFFKSGHQQYSASENAPGAKGLVKPTYFFPSDLQLDEKKIQLETFLARLNKPKIVKNSNNDFFKYRILKEDLQEIKNNILSKPSNQSQYLTLTDWNRNWDVYFINGKSIKELRNNKKFKDNTDLSEFIETHLLAQIGNEELREYYRLLILFSFHHGGFPHSFSALTNKLLNRHYLPNNIISGQPDIQINFAWSSEHQGIQIEEISTLKEKKDADTNEILLPEKGEYYCQTQSCILLKLNETKGGYKLAVSVQSASVDCDNELKFLFFEGTNLLEAFIHYLQSLVTRIRCYFDELVKPSPVLNKFWLSKVGSCLSPKSPVVTECEENGPQAECQAVGLPSYSNQ